MTDDTAQRRLEEQARQAQTLEAIGRLAGSVAHDFNNLLVVIRGYSGLLMKRLDGEELSFVQAIDGAAERAGAFTRQLLVFSGHAATPARPGPAGSLEGDEVVLVVENEGIVRTLITVALESYGYRVMGASGAEEATALAAQAGGSIDLLMTELVMPGTTGAELAETLAAADPALKVLFTSAYPADTVVRHGVTGGRAGFIEKPYSPDDLARKVREVLDQDTLP
jgi:CheY-like chemotaxis protein